MAILGPGQDGGSGSSSSDVTLRDLIDENQSDDDSGGSTGVRDTASRVDEQTDDNGSDDPFSGGTTGSEAIREGGDTSRSDATGSSSSGGSSGGGGSVDDDMDGELQEADEQSSNGSSSTGTSSDSGAPGGNTRTEQTLLDTRATEFGRGFSVSEQTFKDSQPTGESGGTPGGLNRQTAEAVADQEAAAEATAQDFGAFGSILPRRPDSGIGERGGGDPAPSEEAFNDLERAGADLGADTVELAFEAVSGENATGETKDGARSAGGAVGGAVGGGLGLISDGIDAVSFVATGNDVQGAADDPVTRTGQVADAVANTLVSSADRTIRIDESATFDDESLRFTEPVVEVEPTQQGEFGGSVTAGVATSVAGTAAASRLGVGSDLTGKAAKRTVKGAGKVRDFVSNRDSGGTSLVDDSRAQSSVFAVKPDRDSSGSSGGGSSSSSSSGGGSSGGDGTGGGGSDALDQDITGVMGDDPTGTAGTRGRATGNRGRNPQDSSVGNRPPRSLDRAQEFAKRARGGKSERSPDVEQLDRESQSDFFGTGSRDGQADATLSRAGVDADLDAVAVGVGAGLGVGVGLGGRTRAGVDDDVLSRTRERTRSQTRTRTRIDTRTDTDTDTRLNTPGGQTPDTPLRTNTPDFDREIVTPDPDDPPGRVDDVDLPDFDDDNDDTERRRRQRSLFSKDLENPVTDLDVVDDIATKDTP